MNFHPPSLRYKALVAAVVLMLPADVQAQALIDCQRIDTGLLNATANVVAGQDAGFTQDFDPMVAHADAAASWTDPNPGGGSANAQATGDARCLAAQGQWISLSQVEATGMTDASSTPYTYPATFAQASGNAPTVFNPRTTGVLRGTIDFLGSGSSSGVQQAVLTGVCADTNLTAVRLGAGFWWVSGVLQTAGGPVTINDFGPLQSYSCQQTVFPREGGWPLTASATAIIRTDRNTPQALYHSYTAVYFEVKTF